MSKTAHPGLPGTFLARKKSGAIYYRASITYKNKHISLGSFDKREWAHQAYLEAQAIISSQSVAFDDYLGTAACPRMLPDEKAVCLFNFRDNGIYIKNPIYLKKACFEYYYSFLEVYVFDIDDLFYYSEHKIMKRGGHLFVADCGMQVTVLSRYGIKSHAVPGRDYIFVNGNPHDMRYGNIHVVNAYHGVTRDSSPIHTSYHVKIHVNGDYIVGTYPSEEEAAIAYNKAVDVLRSAGCMRSFQTNYIESMTGKEYAEIYSRITISDRLYQLTF